MRKFESGNEIWVLERDGDEPSDIVGVTYLATVGEAALNSDGCITIRNYREDDKNEDNLIVLSRRETEAVIRLFSEIGTMQRNNTLPF